MAVSDDSTRPGVHERRQLGDYTLIRRIGEGGQAIVWEAIHRPLGKQVAVKELKQRGSRDSHSEIRRFWKEAAAMAQLRHPNIVPVHFVGEERGVHYLSMDLVRGTDLRTVVQNARDRLAARQLHRSGDTPRVSETTEIVPRDRDNAAPDSPDNDGAFEVSPPDGRSFSDALLSLHGRSGARSPDRTPFSFVTRIGIAVAEALHHAHEIEIIHRDVKPGNLLLADDGKVVVTDFGLAKFMRDQDTMTPVGNLLGTLRYMSPEQTHAGLISLDARTDIYSLGVTLYELLTLQKAFDGATVQDVLRQIEFNEPTPIRRLNPSIPKDLERIVATAMARDPDERFSTAKELADSLRKFENDEDPEVPYPTLIQKCRRWLRRHRTFATAAAVSLAVVSVTSTASAIVAWNALQDANAARRQADSDRQVAEVARDKAQQLLRQSEGRRLAAQAMNVRDENPALALALGIEGAEKLPGAEADAAILGSLRELHEKRTLIPRHDHPATAIAVGPGSRHCITTVSSFEFGRGNFPALISDLETGETVFRLNDGSAMTSAAWSPDGSLVLTASAPRPQWATPDQKALESVPPAALWVAQTGSRMRVIPGTAPTTVTSRTFSPAGDLVILPGNDNSVRICSTADGSVRSVLSGHEQRILYTAFSADGSQALSLGSDRTVIVWDVADKAEIRRFLVECDSPENVTAEFLGASGNLLLSDDNGSRVVSLTTGERRNPDHWPEPYAAVDPGATRIALYHRYGTTVAVHDAGSTARMCMIQTAGYVLNVRFSPDGRLVAVAEEGVTRLYDSSTGTLAAELRGHSGQIVDLQFLPSGNQLVTAATDLTVRVWYGRSGDQRRTLIRDVATSGPGHYGVSRDSSRIIAATQPEYGCELRGADGRLTVGNMSGYNMDRTIRSDQLVTVTSDRVSLWDAATGAKTAEASFGREPLREAHTVPGSQMVVVLQEGGPAWRWDSRTDEQFLIGSAGDIALDFMPVPGTSRGAVGYLSGRCVLLDLATGGVERILHHPSSVGSVNFTRDGSRLVTVDDQDTARVWSLAQSSDDGEGQNPVLIAGTGIEFDRALFSPDGSRVVTWSVFQQQAVRCWSAETGKLIRATPVATSRTMVAPHPSRPEVAVASQEGLSLWNYETGDVRVATAVPARNAVFLEDNVVSVDAVSQPQDPSDEAGIPAAVNSAYLRVWNASTLDPAAEPQPLSGQPLNLHADVTNRVAALSLATHGAVATDLQQDSPLVTIGGHAAPVVHCGFADDGKRIVCASWDSTVSIWDGNGNRLQLLDEHDQPITSGALSQDGRLLVTADTSGRCVVWDAVEGRRVNVLEGHQGAIAVIQISGDARTLLTAGVDDNLRIWDVKSGTSATIFMERGILAAELSSDGKSVLVVEQQQPTDATDPGKTSNAVLIDTSTREQQRLRLPGTVRRARFHPEGTQLAIVLNAGNLSVRKLPLMDIVRELDRIGQPVQNAAFSPDGRLIAVLLSNDQVTVWNIETGEEVLSFRDSSRKTIEFSALGSGTSWSPFSPDGQWLMTSAEHLRKWPLSPVNEGRRQKPRDLTATERRFFQVTREPQ